MTEYHYCDASYLSFWMITSGCWIILLLGRFLIGNSLFWYFTTFFKLRVRNVGWINQFLLFKLNLPSYTISLLKNHSLNYNRKFCAFRYRMPPHTSRKQRFSIAAADFKECKKDRHNSTEKQPRSEQVWEKN